MNFGQLFQLLLPLLLNLLKGIQRSPVEAQQAFGERLLAIMPEGMPEGQEQEGLPEGAQAAVSGADIGYWFTLLLPFIIRILEALASMPPQQLQTVLEYVAAEVQMIDDEFPPSSDDAQQQSQQKQQDSQQQVGPNNPA